MALWTPAEITTALWLDADDSTTITVDGSSNVEQWDDKSGNLLHFTQSTLAKKPLLVASALNGLSALRFSADELQNTSAMPKDEVTWFVAYKLNSLPVSDGFYCIMCLRADSSNRTELIPTNISGYQPLQFINDLGGSATGVGLSAALNTSPSILSWSFDNVSVTSTSSYSAYVFGASATVGASGTVSIPDAAVSKIGNRIAQNFPAPMDLYEIIGVAGTISTTNRQYIEGYLAWKWGLEANLPTGHPYKDAAPSLVETVILEPFNIGLSINTGNIIGDAHTTLSPLEMGLALDGTPSESVPVPAFSMGLSMDMASALLTRYVAFEPFNLGLSSGFGTVTQNIALSPLEMGLSLDGSPMQSIPVQPFQIGLNMDLDSVSSFETGSAIIRYFCILTGAADGLADVTLPMTSFQARRRSGDPTFLQVVVPTMDYATDIANRPNGTLTIRQAYEQNGIIKQTETIMQAALGTVRTDEGGQNKSVTLTGYSTATFTAQAVTLSGVTYRSTVSGQARYRLARPYIFLNPGDTVTIADDGVTFQVDTMSYFINATTATIELASA